MPIVNDIDRPDVNGVPPKMLAICEKMKGIVNDLAPHMAVKTDDNLCSNITIWGSYQPKEQWSNGIFHNSPYFIFSISPEKGKRYYTEGDKITAELTSLGSRAFGKFRKYTATPDKVIEKVAQWIKDNKPA